MSLATVVTARISNERLVQLTNPDAQAPSAVDTVRRDAACADAAGEFEVYTGVQFNEADPRHIGPAVDLVILILKERGAAALELMSAEREKVVQRLKDLALVTGLNRIMPEIVTEDRGAFPASAFEDATLDPQADEDEDS